MSLVRGSWRYLHSRKFLGLGTEKGAAERCERAGERIARIVFKPGQHGTMRRSGCEVGGGLIDDRGQGGMIAPCARLRRRRGRRLEVAAPLRRRQRGVGIGFLHKAEAALTVLRRV